MPKSFGSPAGLAIVIGLIIGIGLLFMAIAIFYKFVVLGPEVRWNGVSSDNLQSESQNNNLPHNPYRNNAVVPEPVVAHHPSQAFNVPIADAEMGGVTSFSINRTNKPDQQHSTGRNSGRHHGNHGVVPVVEAVLYESDTETYLPNNASSGNTIDSRAQAMRDWYADESVTSRSGTIDINANDARAQAMRDWYDN